MCTKKPRKILLIIPNLGRGGAQQMFRPQLKSLAIDFKVIGCVFHWDGAFAEDHAENIISLEVPAGKNFVLKVLYFILRIIRLKQLKRQKGIEVSISHL